MATIIQVTIRTADAIPENFITNQFAVTGNVDLGADADAVVTAFTTFYDVIRTNFFPSTIAQNGHLLKLYIAGGPQPNYPYLETTFDLAGAPSGVPLPSEVALCLSFQGARTAGLPQARRRGRVYIGPLNTSVNSSGRPESTRVGALLDAAEALYDDLDVIATAESWAVWSTVNGAAVPLTDAWVDDAFDTQRSRGLARTSRETVSFV